MCENRYVHKLANLQQLLRTQVAPVNEKEIEIKFKNTKITRHEKSTGSLSVIQGYVFECARGASLLNLTWILKLLIMGIVSMVQFDAPFSDFNQYYALIQVMHPMTSEASAVTSPRTETCNGMIVFFDVTSRYCDESRLHNCTCISHEQAVDVRRGNPGLRRTTT